MSCWAHPISVKYVYDSMWTQTAQSRKTHSAGFPKLNNTWQGVIYWKLETCFFLWVLCPSIHYPRNSFVWTPQKNPGEETELQSFVSYFILVLFLIYISAPFNGNSPITQSVLSTISSPKKFSCLPWWLNKQMRKRERKKTITVWRGSEVSLVPQKGNTLLCNDG